MKIKGKEFHTIWWDEEDKSVAVIDQRLLPHKFVIHHIRNTADACFAIREMVVRGAPLIGVTAAYGFYLATLEASHENYSSYLNTSYDHLLQTRPTAFNLKWALEEMKKSVAGLSDIQDIRNAAFNFAGKIKQDDIASCKKIGENALSIIKNIAAKKKGEPVNILTHCNAGWLACVDYGTATAGIYLAKESGINIHVWVDETRPRNQGASLTAFELDEEGIPYTLIADNTGGHLMQNGMVDIVIVGADRVAANGDAANKIGTYLKALAAHDNHIPFYVAFPFSTADAGINDGVKEIKIETRSEDEVKFVQGKYRNEVVSVLISPENANALNFGFDVTPARLITALITEKGIFKPHELKSFLS